MYECVCRKRVGNYLQIHGVLQAMQDKFNAMSAQVGNEMEEMGTRVDDLERTIADVMTQAGMELTL